MMTEPCKLSRNNFKVGATSLELEIRLHAYTTQTRTNKRSGAEVLSFMLIRLAHALGTRLVACSLISGFIDDAAIKKTKSIVSGGSKGCNRQPPPPSLKFSPKISA